MRGDVEARSIDGVPLRRDARMSLCRCGLAEKIPFCDNTCRKAHWREPLHVERAGTTGVPGSAPSTDAGG